MDDKNEATRPTATAPVEAGEVTFELRDRVMRACMDPCAFVGPRIQAEDGTYEHMDHWRARAAIAAMTDAASKAHTLRVAEAVREACAAEASNWLGGESASSTIRALDIGQIVEGVGR